MTHSRTGQAMEMGGRSNDRESLVSPPRAAVASTSSSRARAPFPSQFNTDIGSSSLGVPGRPPDRGSSSPGRSGRLSDVSVGTINSYVHVPLQDVNEAPLPSAPYEPQQSNRSALRLGADSSPKKGRSLAPTADDESVKSTAFSSTMRKTSRFFRRFGGPSYPAPTPPLRTPANSASAPVTPIAAEFSRSSPTGRNAPPPPVPQVPTSFVRSPSGPTPEQFADAERPDTTSDPESSSPKLARDTSTTTLRVGDRESRRRSLTMGSPSRSSSRESPRLDFSPSMERTKSGVKMLEEADRLRSELQQWKLDLDGVLGSAAQPFSPHLAGTAIAKPVSAPTSPALTASAMLDAKTDPRRLSYPATLQTKPIGGAQNGTINRVRGLAAVHSFQEGAGPVVAPRASSLPVVPTPEFPSPLPTFSASPVEPPTTPRASLTPSIRLVSPSTPTAATHDVKPSLSSLNGLGLGTVSETPSPSVKDMPLQRRAATLDASFTPTLPLLTTQSPSPSASGLGPNEASRKAMARYSVVAYPSAGLPASLLASRSASLSSLPSDARSPPGDVNGSPESMSRPLEDRAREFAQRCWDEDPTFLERRKMAEWLGSTGRLNQAVLHSYIDFFDFAGLRLDLAFRRLCDKLYLKAETQQVDRILEQFSRRYVETNDGSVYGSKDVTHAVAYSLLLLNTDLHVVDSTTRMSRAQFVRNTVEAIQSQGGQSETNLPKLLFGTRKASRDDIGSFPEASTSQRSLDTTASHKLVRRSSSLQAPGLSSEASEGNSSAPQSTPQRPRPSTASSSPSFESRREREWSNVSGRSHDFELESNLKEMYNAIKAQPIFQPQSDGASGSRSSLSLAPAANSPYGTWNGVSRTASRRSGASTTGSSSSTAFKRASVRGFGSFLGASSSDFARSGSPTPSTTTSLSDDNLAYPFVNSTIGFAHNLSHSIIREQQEDDTQSLGGVSVTDDELALSGPPWAKEGIVYRKHYWESHGKRSKEKSWLQVFVVISQGELRMFRFDGSGGSRGTSTGVGGGDWTSNAQGVGELSLAHALCSAMPPPGYSRDRPHCFVLTLPGGSTYFFHAGTQDLVGEWVATCNYWSARLSKEPLTGGVSNMEYGWNRVPTDATGDDEREEIASVRSAKSGRSAHSRLSSHGSIGGTSMGGSVNDRINIADWQPPAVPSGTSGLSEDAQLDNLRRHVSVVQAELTAHNALRAPMLRLYSPRGAAYNKASANWERKSQYLLSELVKWVTYSDNLAAALRLRALRAGQKEVETMLEAADEIEPDFDVASSEGVSSTLVPSVEQPQLRRASPKSSKDRSSLDVVSTVGADSERDVFFDPETPTRCEA